MSKERVLGDGKMNEKGLPIDIIGNLLTPFLPLQRLGTYPQFNIRVASILHKYKTQITQRRTPLLQTHTILPDVPCARVYLG